MKLTKSQRHTAYIIMLAEFRDQNHNNLGSWFCYLIWNLFRIHDNGFDEGSDLGNYSFGINGISNVMKKYFPELHILFWDSYPNHFDYDKREEILKECIKKTSNF